MDGPNRKRFQRGEPELHDKGQSKHSARGRDRHTSPAFSKRPDPKEEQKKRSSQGNNRQSRRDGVRQVQFLDRPLHEAEVVIDPGPSEGQAVQPDPAGKQGELGQGQQADKLISF